jgi:phosphoglycolate phosphatase-like HAD superfamily hydrolase
MNNYLLIWDIDGTLIQGRGIGRRGMDKAFLELYGIKNGFEGIDMAGMLDSVILRKAYELHNLKGQDSKKYFEVYCECLKEEIKKLDAPIYAPGIPQLLEILHQKDNFYNVLGTGNVKEAAIIKLAVHDMNRFFICGGFGDEEMDRWQVIQQAITSSHKLLNIRFESKNIYIIGDTPRDVECGKKLEAKTIGVATGSYTTSQLLDCGADYVFEDFTDTSAFLSIFE